MSISDVRFACIDNQMACTRLMSLRLARNIRHCIDRLIQNTEYIRNCYVCPWPPLNFDTDDEQTSSIGAQRINVSYIASALRPCSPSPSLTHPHWPLVNAFDLIGIRPTLGPPGGFHVHTLKSKPFVCLLHCTQCSAVVDDVGVAENVLSTSRTNGNWQFDSIKA